MIAKQLIETLKHAQSWPNAAQQELIRYAEEIEAALRGGVYHPTDEERAGIDRGIASAHAGNYASEQDIAALFTKHRPA